MENPTQVNQELITYIKAELSRGTSLEQIKKTLLSKGWSDYDVNEAVSLSTQQRDFLTPSTSQPYEEPTKKSLKLWAILTLVVVITVGGVFAYFAVTKEEAPEEVTETIADCGTDLDCFIQASQSCDAAKATQTAAVELFGVIQTTTAYYELKGLEAGKCRFYVRTEKIDLTFLQETPQDIADQAQAAVKTLEGRDGMCRFSTNDLTAMLGRWEIGDFEGGASCTLLVGGESECTYTGDWEVAEDCQGDIFSQEL